jgi:hypothetical protein
LYVLRRFVHGASERPEKVRRKNRRQGRLHFNAVEARIRFTERDANISRAATAQAGREGALPVRLIPSPDMMGQSLESWFCKSRLSEKSCGQ